MLQKLLDYQIEFELTATSYDSGENLKSKYPEVQGILKFLQKEVGVKILHGVDATRYLPVQLTNEDGSCPPAYQHVIFNFPHLGIEDASAHSCFIAHVMYRVKDIMDRNQSTLYITLAHQQEERWLLSDQAERNGFIKFEVIPFRRGDWPRYTTKRHHCGKSFHARVEGASHFCFKMIEVEYCPVVVCLLFE